MKSLRDLYEVEKQRFIKDCTLCGKCVEVCSTYPHSDQANIDPVEMVKMRMDFLKGGELKPEVYDSSYTCPPCVKCQSACPVDIYMGLVQEIIRYEINERGIKAPNAIYDCIPERDFNFFNILNNMQMKPSQVRWLGKIPSNPKPVDTIFFAGCLGHSQPDKIFIGIDILNSLGVNFVTLGGMFACCSDVNSVTGDADASDKGAKALMAGFAAFKPQRVLLGCTTCVYRLNKLFSPFIPHSYEMVGLTQFLANRVNQLKFKRSIKKRVTYQDACKLGRGMGDWESPRALIRAIPGIRLVEGENIKEKNICCGGVAQICRYNVTKQMNFKRMEDAKVLEADAVVELDLGCHLALSHLENKYGIEVINIWNLLSEALGFDYEDKLKKYRLYEDADKVMAEAAPYLKESHYNPGEVRHFWEHLMSVGF